jgi:hypothetical protein
MVSIKTGVSTFFEKLKKKKITPRATPPAIQRNLLKAKQSKAEQSKTANG